MTTAFIVLDSVLLAPPLRKPKPTARLPSPTRRASRRRALQNLNQGDVGAFGPTGTALTLAHLYTQELRQSHHSLLNLLLVQIGKSETQGVGQRRLHVKITAGREEDAPFASVHHQLAGIEAGRKFAPETHPAFGTRPTHTFGHAFAQGIVQNVEPVRIDFAHACQMLVQEAPLQKFSHSRLREL